VAVILLVFRDTILGLVASVQILTHKLVDVGDWIEMPKYNADGDVIKVSLTTIQVHNFDKTITSIPTHALVSETFRNWQAMRESGGRRIKRFLNIDLKSVKALDSDMCDRFESMTLLADYIRGKREDLRNCFENHDVIISVVNGRWLTNLGTFRVYVENYLKQHSQIRNDMTCMVRQLQPTREGMPLEIYAFTNVVDWGEYEKIQADIFDHIVSVLPEFDLRLFQDPSEFDYAKADKLFSHRIDDRARIAIEADTNGVEKEE
jgi:miniconductance mechanosensitive channel